MVADTVPVAYRPGPMKVFRVESMDRSGRQVFRPLFPTSSSVPLPRSPRVPRSKRHGRHGPERGARQRGGPGAVAVGERGGEPVGDERAQPGKSEQEPGETTSCRGRCGVQGQQDHSAEHGGAEGERGDRRGR